MLRTRAVVFSAIAFTSSRVALRAASAPAILYRKKMPATPRRRASLPFGAEATSSAPSTCIYCCHFGSEFEVHHIAAVVPVDVENAGAIVDGFGDGEHSFSTWRLKHAADTAAVEHALAHVTKEERQMAGTSSSGERNFAGVISARDQAAQIAVYAGDLIWMRCVDALEHLVHHVLGLIDQLFHRPSSRRSEFCISIFPREAMGGDCAVQLNRFLNSKAEIKAGKAQQRGFDLRTSPTAASADKAELRNRKVCLLPACQVTLTLLSGLTGRRETHGSNRSRRIAKSRFSSG